MLITNLKLSKVGRHESLDFDANASVIGLSGINGVGKSTIFEMLRYAFTGETEYKLESYVRYGEGNASVEVTFIKNGQQGTIFRQFGKTNKRKLTWNGEEKTGAKEVETRMAEIFSADRQAIGNAVFVQQGMLESILFSKQADRRNMFIKLVNMAFCSKRADMVLGKIRSLEATITDLGPMIQALTSQRDSAAITVTKAQEEVAILPDYSVEIAYCEAYAKNEDRLKRTVATIGQCENELTAYEVEKDMLLVALGIATVDEAKPKFDALESKVNLIDFNIETFDTISGELVHYDRVSGEIKLLNDRLKATLDEIRTLNPENKSIEAIKVENDKASTQHALYPWRRQTEQSLNDWKLYKLQAEKSLIGQKATTKTDKEVESLATEAAKKQAQATMIRSLLKTQERIAQCIGDQVNLPEAKCPDCGLKLANPGDLKPEALAAYRKSLYELDAEVSTLYSEHERYSEENTEHLKFTREKQAASEHAITEIAKIEKQLANNVPTMGEDEAKALFEKTNAQRERLPALTKLSKQQSSDLMNKTVERGRYTQAMANLDCRSRYTPEQRQKLADLLQAATTSFDGYQTPYAQLGQTTRLIHSTELRKNDLIAQKHTLEQFMDSTIMPASVMDLAVQLNANIEAMKMELKNRNDLRQQSLGRLEEANKNYKRLNDEYQDLLRRAEADVAKKKLIDDLQTLRQMLDDNGLPMAVVRYHFTKLAALTQEALTQLDANFAISVDNNDELGFTFVRLDEPVQYEMPMNKLSGGQKVRLCVAFLMAVQKRLVREVGLLVLDEPSVHVDPAGVESLAELLRGLQAQLKNTELQVWVADHHPLLTDCYQKTLTLK